MTFFNFEGNGYTGARKPVKIKTTVDISAQRVKYHSEPPLQCIHFNPLHASDAYNIRKKLLINIAEQF